MESKPRTPKEFVLAYKIPIIVVVALLFLIIGTLLAQNAVNKQSKESSANTTNTSTGTSSKTTASTGSPLQIKELGVQIKVPYALDGMTYALVTYQTPKQLPPMVNLKLSQYTQLANKCLGTTASNAYSFATLVKQSGKAKAGDTRLLKQFDSYYIIMLGSSVPSSLKCKDEATRQALDKLAADLNSALSTAFSTAKQI